MMNFMTIESTHPALAGDRYFFEKNPHRLFRARAFLIDEYHSGMLEIDPTGEPGRVNITIIKRVYWGRIRCFFRQSTQDELKTDRQIIDFLESRGINPSYFGMKRMIKCH